MEGSSDSEKAPTYPSFGPPCDHCNRPDTSNMTWKDGGKYFFSTYFASPRMGPVGYILDSPYSPFRVEREIPSRNWRDAFEDLLALDTGGNTISHAHRKAEDTYAASERYDLASGYIAMINTFMRENQKLDSRLAKLCKVATKSGDKENAARFDGPMRSRLKQAMDDLTKRAKHVKSDYEAKKDKSASSLKSRGHWIASLMTSGALPGWYWNELISVDGPVIGFGRVDAPPELMAGITVTEKELSQQFDHGQPHVFGSPQPLPRDRLQALSNGVLEAPRSRIGPLRSFDASPSSTLVQAGRTESFKRPDGSTGTKVSISNQPVNGPWVDKDYIQEPGKVLEEICNARKSMESLRAFLVEGPQVDGLDQFDELNRGIDQKFADYEDDSYL